MMYIWAAAKDAEPHTRRRRRPEHVEGLLGNAPVVELRPVTRRAGDNSLAAPVLAEPLGVGVVLAAPGSVVRVDLFVMVCLDGRRRRERPLTRSLLADEEIRVLPRLERRVIIVCVVDTRTKEPGLWDVVKPGVG